MEKSITIEFIIDIVEDNDDNFPHNTQAMVKLEFHDKIDVVQQVPKGQEAKDELPYTTSHQGKELVSPSIGIVQ